MQSEFAPDGTAFDISGQHDAPVLVLIHGLGLSREIWRPHLVDFQKHYQVITYDLFGHGKSAAAPETTTLSLYAKQLADLLDHIRCPSASIIGFSIGGMINRRFAMNYPNKTTTLVILNSPHDRGDELQQQVEARAAKVREQGAMATLDDALKRWFTADYLENGNGVNAVKKWRQQVDAESYAQAAWVLANGVRELIKPKPAITHRSLVMTCENDTGSTPAMSHAIATELNADSTVIIPRLQHLGLIQEPQSFTQPILHFLDGILK